MCSIDINEQQQSLLSSASSTSLRIISPSFLFLSFRFLDDSLLIPFSLSHSDDALCTQRTIMSLCSSLYFRRLVMHCTFLLRTDITPSSSCVAARSMNDARYDVNYSKRLDPKKNNERERIRNEVFDSSQCIENPSVRPPSPSHDTVPSS